MRFRVEVGAHLMEQLTLEHPATRSPKGEPDQADFRDGPLAAAIDRFKRFDQLPEAAGPSIRVATVVDPMFGAVTFTGVLIDRDLVELADYIADPEFWAQQDDTPDG